MHKLLITLSMMLALSLTACTALTATTTPGASISGTLTASPSLQVAISPPSTPRGLTIWITSPFAPDSTTPAGALLAERLTTFEQANPGTIISLRLKEESGPSGLLETLTAAYNAAPAALPDVIALDPVALNTAILKELVVPLDGLLAEPQSPEWYDHAIAAARINGGFFGLPFASEAELLAYRTDHYQQAPLTWSDILSVPAGFLFPAGDEGASFTLSQYMALDGPLYDESGRPSFDPAILGDILAFYGSSLASNILPSSALDYTSALDTWAALRAYQTASAVAPLSAYLTIGDPKTISAAPIPTRSGPGICPTETWSWAIVTHDPARQELAVQLLTWLTQPEFLGPWTYALGMLPPTASGLAQWPEDAQSALASSLVTVAQPRPSAEALATFGPALHTAVEAVLSGGINPSTAALDALRALQSPEPD